jgi:hypothetical protein
VDDEAAQRAPQRSCLSLVFAALISVLVVAGVGLSCSTRR